jgi:hypothetical protein
MLLLLLLLQVCFGFFLMLGTVGWRASLMFVRRIYQVRVQACLLCIYPTAVAVVPGLQSQHVCVIEGGSSAAGLTSIAALLLATLIQCAGLLRSAAGNQVRVGVLSFMPAAAGH